MTWSLSKLGTWERCAARYKFSYLDKLPSPQSPSASRGTVLHGAIEQYLKREIHDLPEEISYYQGFLDGILGMEDYKLHPELKLAVDQDWKPADFDEGFWWRGVLDLLLVHPEGVIVYDWKTGKEYSDHSDQREIYSLAILSHYDVPEVQAIHVYLDLRKNVMEQFHRDQLLPKRERWQKRVDRMLKDQDFIPSPGFYCRYCPYARASGGPCQF